MAYTDPTVPVGAVFLISLRQRWQGQRILNTYHYRVEQNTNGKVVSYMADQFHAKFQTPVTGLYATHKAFRESSCVLEDVQIQMIAPNRYVAIGKGMSENGSAIALNIDITQLAAAITFRSVEATRRGVSTIKVPWAASTGFTTNGIIDPVALPLLTAHANAHLGLNDLGEGVLVRPIIYHADLALNYSYVESFLVQPTLRVMRRRTVGLGE